MGNFIKHLNQFNIETLEIPIEYDRVKVMWNWIATHTKTVKRLIVVDANITLQDMREFLSDVSPSLEFLDLLQTSIAIRDIYAFTDLLLKTNIKYLKLPRLHDNVVWKLRRTLRNKIVVLLPQDCNKTIKGHRLIK
ncbi:hypothetical protein ROZALSC1DRAFT_28840 [Rozella allomycis CSF55]|uniref:Uncharacterized protein n=1 Tax=Rozella allomycis (strain CSF55) TaxID=988480 RepID=A0A075AQ63_ROZAC|nr:hypothetical protein O9G_003429 [Rozella allomycis CSF55]RKP19580.1 hypothetical protein ROZALSC1DRAFT_28840 [Rozella allomycis CSF55]|eukprot:EPZ32285.1 hypothetical protein O9G_003429 [Rozella allomycis CSF55]